MLLCARWDKKQLDIHQLDYTTMHTLYVPVANNDAIASKCIRLLLTRQFAPVTGSTGIRGIALAHPSKPSNAQCKALLRLLCIQQEPACSTGSAPCCCLLRTGLARLYITDRETC